MLVCLPVCTVAAPRSHGCYSALVPAVQRFYIVLSHPQQRRKIFSKFLLDTYINHLSQQSEAYFYTHKWSLFLRSSWIIQVRNSTVKLRDQAGWKLVWRWEDLLQMSKKMMRAIMVWKLYLPKNRKPAWARSRHLWPLSSQPLRANHLWCQVPILACCSFSLLLPRTGIVGAHKPLFLFFTESASAKCFYPGSERGQGSPGHKSPGCQTFRTPCLLQPQELWFLALSRIIRASRRDGVCSSSNVQTDGIGSEGPWLRNYQSLVMETHDPCMICGGESQSLFYLSPRFKLVCSPGVAH